MLYSRSVYQHHIYGPRRSYGFFKFLGDVFMTIFTGGFWLIWIFIREMRNR